MKTLKQPYLEIEMKSGYSFGGNQAWFARKYLRDSACGVIGAADVLLHLQGKMQMTETEYVEFAKMLYRKYLPVIPKFGMNGLTLMIGLNRYFAKKKLPYRSYWNISKKKMLTRIDGMLARDIPVIMSIGPNFPKFWGKEKVTLYMKTKEGNYTPKTKVKAHFVIVTGRDHLWLQISSWGKEYYIDYKEFEEYVKRHSNYIVSNIICIQEIKKIK